MATPARFILLIHLWSTRLAVVAWLAASPGVNAKTVYVQQDASPGGDGSHARPFVSIREGLAALGSGDRLVIGPGIFREGELTVGTGGTRNVPVEISGSGANSTLVVGSVVASGWRHVSGAVWQLSSWKENSQQVLCDGFPLQQLGRSSVWHDRKVGAGNVALPTVGEADVAQMSPGSFFFDAAAQRLLVRLSGDSDPNQHRLEVSAAPWLLRGSKPHVRIRGIGFQHSSGSSAGQSILVSGGPGGWHFEDCVFALGDMWGLSLSRSGNSVRNCVIRDNGGLGISINNSDEAHGWLFYADAPHMETIIESCVVSGNNYRRFNSEWQAGGMKFIPSVRGLTVRNCRVIGNKGPGIWFDHCLGSNRIEGNWVEGNSHGIFVEISHAAASDPAGYLVRNNVVVGNRSIGVYVSASESVTVERNTILKNWANVVLHGMPRDTFRLRRNQTTRNIVGQGEHADLVLFVGAGAAENSVSANFYTSPDSGAVSTRPLRAAVVTGVGFDVRFHSIGALNEIGVEEGGRSGNAGFLNPEAGDYRLMPGSPATGYGVENPGPLSPTDLEIRPSP